MTVVSVRPGIVGVGMLVIGARVDVTTTVGVRVCEMGAGGSCEVAVAEDVAFPGAAQPINIRLGKMKTYLAK